MHNGSYILKTENLNVGYGENNVLTNVCIDVEKGEILVIIGQNGSGKSTLLKTLTGIIPKKAGNIWIKNQFYSRIQTHQLVNKGFSYFAQGGLIMPDLTVYEHLCLAAMQNVRKLQKTYFDITFAEFPKLKEMQRLRAGNLSGGERQMLSFAILLMQQTDTWLLDEPTAGLSPDLVKFTSNYLQRKNREGITMLLVEHNMDVSFNLATHIAIAKEGTLTKKFTRQHFSTNEFLKYYIYN